MSGCSSLTKALFVKSRRLYRCLGLGSLAPPSGSLRDTILSDLGEIVKLSVDTLAKNTCEDWGVEGGVSSSSEDVGGESKYKVASETSGGERETA